MVTDPVAALAPESHGARDAALAEHRRIQARRVAVVAAALALILLPCIQLLEGWLGYAPDGTWWVHALLRAPVLLAAVLVLALRCLRPLGGWPRPAALTLALMLVSVGWGLLLLHQVVDSSQYIMPGLTIGTVAVAVMATAGARDLLVVYAPPLMLGVLAFRWLVPERARDGGALVYPILAMIVGAVIAEMLHHGSMETFEARRVLERTARTEPLTGLLNRRAMDDVLRAEHARSVRHQAPYALVMVDMDHFKRINDAHGHDVGDQILRQVGARLADSVRVEDRLARWGGEEFLALLQDADVDDARQVAERMRSRVCTAAFPTSAGPLRVTISVGVAVRIEESSVQEVLLRADKALYEAKQAGRDRSVVG